MRIRYLLLITVLLLVIFSLPAAADPVMVLVREREERTFAEDGENELLNCYYKNAIVKIDGNPDAENAVNSRLETLENEFAADWPRPVGEQIEFRQTALDSGMEWQPWYRVEIRRELTAERADDAVISFKVYDYTYTGGAHGMYAITGIQFDTKTGKELMLADLSEDPAALRDILTNEIIEQCQKVEGLWWYDEESLRPQIEAIVDRDSWYLTDEDIVFHSTPYELGPYAVGAIEFIIPYENLPAMNY